ncbi:beta-glucosidase family protein [Nocardioides mangrovi]|uniref:Glycoside hydrolase family 3 C-terminal domain-containing protein n=1 Tax=Nocardioides mangrovi TaxID=2874580 RepID=A0ABS7UIQ3_9ACTN|nr:glycoside hydrolase family 3 C-terminal domain-containing protein [Nocardioides mangrovi]MBZ5740685.1 glycoside hydrolase family 3 C-terminal domain-containing protein [Nocardioides mangrovi]
MARLTLEQKVRLLTGADFWALYDESAVGLRRMVTSDGPAGVRGELWDERDPSTNIPSPTAIAASWDAELVETVGRLLAHEARRKGVDVVLAPTVNLHRSPYGGRHFECLSEDPVLTGDLGLALVRGLQSQGVGATVKHFVANDSETDRLTVDARVDERTLRELYLAPFERIVRDGGVWAVMAAYNTVNGTTMTESPMLRDVLHDEWGFDGVTMTDWYAGRSTVPAALGGLDLIMPGPTGPWRDALVEAVRDGRVDEALVDDKVVRLLRLASRVGALADGPAALPVEPWTDEESDALVQRAAAAGFVLVRNEPVGPDPAPVLPLRPDVRRVAVIGPNAREARFLGGGSALVFPPATVSPLAGLLAALGPDVEVTYCLGARGHERVSAADPALLTLLDGERGIRVEFRGAGGAVLGVDHRLGSAFNWNNAFEGVDPALITEIALDTVVTADQTGDYRIGASGVGRFRLRLDDKPAFDELLELPPGADPVEGLMRPPQEWSTVRLEAGQSVRVSLVHVVKEHTPDEDLLVSLQLAVDCTVEDDDASLAHAVADAAAADVAIVVVGTSEEVESEGFDRTGLALPGRQDELVRRVAAARPETVVVVNAGAPVLLPWRDEVAATLLAWFPGQEFGGALADVLTGRVEPGGRLPTTWPAVEGRSLPSTTPVDGALAYDEGIHVGYRRFLHDQVEPAYWFGHGLGYTTWSYDAVAARDDGIAVTVTNTGERAGRHLVQAYLARPDSRVDRPTRWLAAYAWVSAEPGQTVGVDLELPARAFEHWDVTTAGWVREPGVFTVEIGPSAGEVALRAGLG